MHPENVQNVSFLQPAIKRRVVEIGSTNGDSVPPMKSGNPTYFQDKVIKLKGHSERDSLIRAIRFLAASRDSTDIPKAILFVHAAMETALASMENISDGRNVNHKPPAYKKLIRRLHEALDAHALEHGEPSGWLSNAKVKLAEIRRPPIIARIEEQVAAQNIDISDIWHDAQTMSKDLSIAFESRNDLVHQAKIESSSGAGIRWKRLCLLCERFILISLG